MDTIVKVSEWDVWFVWFAFAVCENYNIYIQEDSLFLIGPFFSSTPKRAENLVFSGDGSQITKQRSRSVKQKALGSICAELNRPAGKGMLEGKGSRLLYGRADVNGIIQIVAECVHPAFRGGLLLSVAGCS